MCRLAPGLARLRLGRRPGEAGAGRLALEGVVACVRPGRGKGDVEVEGVVAAVGCEGAEVDRAEAVEGAVVDLGAGLAVVVLVDDQVERRGEVAGGRAGEGVLAGERAAVRDGDRAGRVVAD